MLVVFFVVVLSIVSLFTVAIAFGGPKRPPPMRSISDPFVSVDFSEVPPATYFGARDGTMLAYRRYASALPAEKGSIILIHGSSSRSGSMHPLAKGFARAGYGVYALDVRGHGESGVKGRIAYIGQLEDDLEDFLADVGPAGRKTLVGFSSGGGFALRFAAGARQRLFDRYVLLSPFLHPTSPTSRRDAGGWTAVGLPRTIALVLLNLLGVTVLNDLPIVSFALDEKDREFLTPWYSFSLAMNFRPNEDYRADARAVQQPMQVLVGQEDEVFRADRFVDVFRETRPPVPVTLVPDTGHMELTLTASAVDAVIASMSKFPDLPSHISVASTRSSV